MKIKIILGLLAFFLVIQVVPYGREHINPKVVNEPHWDSSKTRALFMRACGNCHSNETKWPMYSNIAPISWLVTHDVQEGREHLNISNWLHQKKNKGNESAGEVREGEMPPLIYMPTHPEAWLSKDEKKELIRGLVNTFGDKK